MCTTQVLEQVSGSADHRKEYDKLKTAKDQAEAASLLAYQKKKGLAAQRRQVRDQKTRPTRTKNCETSSMRRVEMMRFLVSRNCATIDQTGPRPKLNWTERSRNVWKPLRGLLKKNRKPPDALKEASSAAERADQALAQKTQSLRGGVAPRVAAAKEAAEQASRDADQEKAAAAQADQNAKRHETLVKDLRSELQTEDRKSSGCRTSARGTSPPGAPTKVWLMRCLIYKPRSSAKTASRAFRLDAARRARDTEEADVEALQREVDDVIKRRNEAASGGRVAAARESFRRRGDEGGCRRAPGVRTLYKRRRPLHL